MAAQAGPGRANHTHPVRITLLLILTLVSLVTRASEHWQVLMQLPSDEILFKVSDNNTDFKIAIGNDSAITQIHSTLSPRYTQQVFYVPAAASGIQRKLLVRRSENIADEPKISVKKIELSPDQAFREAAFLLSDIALSWRVASAEQRSSLLSRIADYLVENPDIDDQFVDLPSVQTTYLRMLFEYKDLTRLIDHADMLLETQVHISLQQQSQITLYLAMALAEQGNFARALELVNWLEQNSTNEVNEMGDNKAVISGLKGLCLVFIGILQKNESLIFDGQTMLQSSITFAKEVGDHKLVANGLNNLSIPLYMKGAFQQIEENYTRALKAHQKSGVERDMRHTLSNFAMLRRNQGNYLDAIKYNRLAVEVLAPNDSAALTSIYYNNLGTSYYAMGDYSRAERYFKLLTAQRNQIDRADFQVITSLYLARIYRSRDDYDMAINVLGPLLSSESSSGQYRWLVLLERGRTLLQRGELQAASDALKRLEASYTGAARPDEYLTLLLFKAELYWLNNEPVAFNSVMYELEVKLNESDDFPLQQLKFIQLKLAYLSRMGEEAKSEDYFQKGLDIVQRIFYSVRGTSHGVGWRNRSEDFLASYLDFIYQQKSQKGINKTHKFFSVWNQINGINLFWQRQSAFSHEKKYTDIADLQNELWQLERDIVASQNNLPEQQDALWLKKNQLQEKIRAVTEEQVLRTRHLSSNDELNVEQIQNSLSAKQIMLGVQTGKKRSYLLAVTAENIEIYPVVDGATLSKSLALLRKNIFAGQSVLQPHIQRLNQQLKLKTALADKTDVFWIANNELQLLPLKLLLSEPNQAWPGRVTGIISVNEFWRTIEQKDVAEKDENLGVAVFAASEFALDNHTAKQELASKEQFRNWRTSLPDLPWTKLEAQQIETVFGEQNVTVFSGKKATSEAFDSDFVHRAAILHVATHAYYNPETPDISGLAVYPEQHNLFGFLSVSKISSRPFHNRLVILSGCETMLGKVSDGEGALGLSRALLDSGANATISTLWPVPDKATAKFMGYFYIFLQENHGDIASALAGAQVLMQSHRRYRHPKYWAGFLLTVVNKSHQNVIAMKIAKNTTL